MARSISVGNSHLILHKTEPMGALQRQLFIDYHYNFQMHPQKQHFLFVLLLTLIVRSQVLNPIGSCLGNCVNCPANELSICKGTLPCEWGYYMNSDNGTCDLAPTKQLLWSQLGERSTLGNAPVSESWGDSTKQTVCEYNSTTGKKYIDVLGLFSGVTMLEKTFQVNNNSQLFELSFNLIRDEWMPFNDFLLVDISSNEETLHSIQVSYQKRIKVESQATTILCGNKRVLSQKFNIKIENNNNIGSSLTVVFTSFLYNSQWAISNIKFIAACTHFSSYDSSSETCSVCDTDSYLVTLNGGEKYCEKCSELCRTCSSKTNCTVCLDGAVLDKNGTCTFGPNYKSQKLLSLNSMTSCGAVSYYTGSSTQKIAFAEIKNENSQLYDEIQINFKFYYNPNDWRAATTDKISIKINKIEAFTLSYKNLTNIGTIACSLKSNPIAVIEILTNKKVQNDNSIEISFEFVGKNMQVQFGVSDVSVKSIKKQSPFVETLIFNNASQVNTNTSLINKTTAPSSNLTNNTAIPLNSSNQSTNSNTTSSKPEPTLINNNNSSFNNISIPQGLNQSNQTNASSQNSSLNQANTANASTQVNVTSPNANNQTNTTNATQTIAPQATATNASNQINATKVIQTSQQVEVSTNQPSNKTVSEQIEPISLNQSNTTNHSLIIQQFPIQIQPKVALPQNKTINSSSIPIIQNIDIDEIKNEQKVPTPPSMESKVIEPSNVVNSSSSSNKNSLTTDLQPLPQIPQTLQTPPLQDLTIPTIQIIYSPSNPQEQASTIQKISSSSTSSTSYIPTRNSQKSGLHVVISQPPAIQNCQFAVQIDKLPADSYSINDTYVLDGDLHLFIAITSSFIDGTITVFKQSSSRLLQGSTSTVIAVVSVNRFDSLSSSQLSSIETFSIVFEFFAWVGVVLIIFAVLSGYGIVVEQYVLSLQLIFLHVYIAADYLPLTFRDVVGGLSNIQNLNFFLQSHGQSIEKSWLGNVVQNGPIRFFLFNTDINFTREFYPIILINAFYLIWFVALVITKRYILRKDLIDEQKPFYYKVIDNVVNRPINYMDQIWRYQFLATIWYCFIQFYNLRYPEGSNRSEAINAVLCIACFVFTLAWPTFISFYCRKYYYENQYSDYLYKFEDLYYRRIPEFYLPSNHHRIGFPIVKTTKIFLCALIIAYLGSIASLTLLLLIFINIFEVGYAKYYEIYSDMKYFAHKLIQNAVFALIQLILFFLCNFSSLALTESFIYIGFVLSGMCLIIILNGLARAADLGSHKYHEMFQEVEWVLNDRQPKTQRIV